MEVFQQLGKHVEDLWREKGFSEDSLPAICEAALRDADLPSKVSAWEIVNWALAEKMLPEQRDLAANFGDPPITLFNAENFHIDIYFWLEATTEIHQHGFCGAFQVLLGSSIHAGYDFDTKEKITANTELGGLSLDEVELLKVGDIRQILPGRQFIHALFHLDNPSATIVMRTHKSTAHLPQFSYRKPTLAVNPFYEDPTAIKKMQSISMLVRTKHADSDRLIAELLASSDFQTSYYMLSNIKRLLKGGAIDELFGLDDATRFERMLDVTKKTHGVMADTLPNVFVEQDRIDEIVRLRSYISDADHRFFLALLLNVPDRQNILSLVERRFTGTDPIDKVLDWSLELSETKVLGLNQSNALGIDDFGDHDLFVLENILKDASDENIRAAAQNTYPENMAADIISTLPARIEKLRRSVLLRQLF